MQLSILSAKHSPLWSWRFPTQVYFWNLDDGMGSGLFGWWWDSFCGDTPTSGVVLTFRDSSFDSLLVWLTCFGDILWDCSKLTSLPFLSPHPHRPHCAFWFVYWEILESSVLLSGKLRLTAGFISSFSPMTPNFWVGVHIFFWRFDGWIAKFEEVFSGSTDPWLSR